MQKNSTTKKAKLKVGQFVKAGTFLGFEGKVGCASGDHLHFEVGVPRAKNPIQKTGGYLSGSKLQEEWEKATSSKFLTRNLTGYSSGNSVKYAAIWRK